MVDPESECTSCGKSLVASEGNVRFDCPRCGETEFIRCNSCRVQKNTYECGECGFEGP